MRYVFVYTLQHLFIWSLSQHAYERRHTLTLTMSLFNLFIEKMTTTSGVCYTKYWFSDYELLIIFIDEIIEH